MRLTPAPASSTPDGEAERVRRRRRRSRAGSRSPRRGRSACRPPSPRPPPGVTAATVGRSQCAATSSVISNEPSGMPVTRLRKRRPLGHEEVALGVGLPEHPPGLVRVRRPRAPCRGAAARSRRPARRRPPCCAVGARAASAVPAQDAAGAYEELPPLHARPLVAASQKAALTRLRRAILSPGKAPEPSPFGKDRIPLSFTIPPEPARPPEPLPALRPRLAPRALPEDGRLRRRRRQPRPRGQRPARRQARRPRQRHPGDRRGRLGHEDPVGADQRPRHPLLVPRRRRRPRRRPASASTSS